MVVEEAEGVGEDATVMMAEVVGDTAAVIAREEVEVDVDAATPTGEEVEEEVVVETEKMPLPHLVTESLYLTVNF